MKSNKTIASLLTMTLLFAFVLASLPLTAIVHATVTPITMLTHWNAVKESAYWEDITNYYETSVDTSVDITFEVVDFPDLYNEITLRHVAGNDPDIIHMHAMWIPAFANWKTMLLAEPPQAVQDNIKADFSPAAVSGVTYKGTVWGLPTEYNTWALVYNRVLIENKIDDPSTSADDKAFLTTTLNRLEANVTTGGYQPITWNDLKRAARLLTVWDTSTTPPTIVQNGFFPFVEGMPEEQRFQFMSLLWSNGGEYLDLSVPTTLFNSQSGYEVMQLYYDLGFSTPPETRAYDPLNIPDVWWTAWEEQSIALAILPTWMQYIREAMVENFYNMGVSVLPRGPSLDPGDFPTSLAYGWVMATTQKAVNDGKETAVWNFLNWLNTPMAAEAIPEATPGMRVEFGPVPRGAGCTILGDYLIADSIIPSRMSDQSTGVVLLGYEEGDGYPGDQILTDFWFEGFITIANLYGRPDKPFIKSEEVQAEIGLMFERVVLIGDDPTTAVDDAAATIQALLPMSGDIDLNGEVDIFEVVFLIVAVSTPAAIPGSSKWVRGRCDFNDDGIVDVLDIAIYIQNFGRTGDP